MYSRNKTKPELFNTLKTSEKPKCNQQTKSAKSRAYSLLIPQDWRFCLSSSVQKHQVQRSRPHAGLWRPSKNNKKLPKTNKNPQKTNKNPRKNNKNLLFCLGFPVAPSLPGTLTSAWPSAPASPAGALRRAPSQAASDRVRGFWRWERLGYFFQGKIVKIDNYKT